MKILHFITSLRTGGAERLVLDLIPRLRAIGHEVDLLVMDGTDCIFTRLASERGITVHSLGIGASAMHNPLLAMRLRHFLIKGHYNIIHTHNTPCQMLAAAVAPHSAMLVTTEHNTDNRRRKNKLWRPIDQMMYSRYRSIIACGEETASSLSAYMPELSHKISIVSNGIDLSTFAGTIPAADIRQRFPTQKIIVMVAAFRPQKDHTTTLRALSLLPDDYALVLAGTGDTLEEHISMAKTLGIHERVMFAGTRSDIASIYATSDVAVLSTHHEGLSLAAVEAMASGRPLVASDVDGLRHTVTPGAILFPDGDAEALASKIHMLCSDRQLWNDTAGACRRRAADFDIENTALGYIDIYKRLSK